MAQTYDNVFDMLDAIWKAQDAGETVVASDDLLARTIGFQGTLHSWRIKLTTVTFNMTSQCKTQAHWKIRDRIRTVEGRKSLLDPAVRNSLKQMLA